MIKKSLVFILSEELDPELDEIINWFRYYKIEYFHVKSTDFIWIHNFEFENFKLISAEIINTTIDRKINFNEIYGFLYRGGDLNLNLKSFFDLNIYNQEIKNNINDEIIFLKRLFFKSLSKLEKCFCNPFNARPDKFEMSELAFNLGFKTPSFNIITSKKELNLISKKNSYITKPFTDIVVFREDNYRCGTYTCTLDFKVKELKNIFFPSLIQQKIDIQYELRVFFIGNELYTGRYLYDNSIVDFRKEKDGVVKIVPYFFNESERLKILSFISNSNYKSGSIDLIRCSKKELYFLEINPIGAFGWLSQQCNFHLAEKISKYYLND